MTYKSIESDDRKVIPIVTRSILEYQEMGSKEQIDELLSSDPPPGLPLLMKDMAQDEATKIINDLWKKGFIIVKQIIKEET